MASMLDHNAPTGAHNYLLGVLIPVLMFWRLQAIEFENKTNLCEAEAALAFILYHLYANIIEMYVLLFFY